VKEELLSPPGDGTLAKAFYFLLYRHREVVLQEHGILATLNAPAQAKAKTITRLHMSPLSKKNRPLSLDSATAPEPRSLMAYALERGRTEPTRPRPHLTPLVPPASPVREASRRSPVGPRPRPASTPTGSRASTPTNDREPPESPVRRARVVYDPRTPPQARRARAPTEPMSAPAHRTAFAFNASTLSQQSAVLSPPLVGMISPPRVADPAVQRTIDDLANRMNVLVRAQTSPAPEADSAVFGKESTAAVGHGKENVNARAWRQTHGELEERAGLGLGKSVAKDMGSYGSDRITRSMIRERERKTRGACSPSCSRLHRG
jgi:hypothetical protein